MIAKIFIFLVRISPAFQRAIWRWWYQRLGKRAQDSGWTFMNYGYKHTSQNILNLKSSDESDRMFIQLYDYVASQLPIKDSTVLEVGSGRGGGASFVSRYHHPKSITGLDYSKSAIKLSARLHGTIDNLNFKLGDAENLPFKDNTFDAVINIESSHCYGNMEKFLSEVSRIVKPGGYFGWADLRAKDMVQETEFAFEKSDLTCIKNSVITSEVLNALDDIHDVKMTMITNNVPKFLQTAFTDFAGVKNSKIYNSFKQGNAVYLSKILKK
tara:strand:- start:2647 stop:3453 length:807 start_codon:yes stop_codon:yes gene_type:complete